MRWLLGLNADLPVAHAIGVIVLVCMAGMALGSIRVRGAGLGSAGVAPTVAYAMVYPLTMLLRVLTAQALTFILCS
jgi:uncharacterized transporter YbjL